MREAQEGMDARLAAAIADATAVADARVAVALEATTAADARVACAFLKAEEVAAQHAAELRDLKAAATGHADELQRLRTGHANTLVVLRQEYTTQAEALKADLGRERKVLEIMKANYRRKQGAAANARDEEEGCNTCIICLDGGADQMPFECQHVVMCGGMFTRAQELTSDCAHRIANDSKHCPMCINTKQRP